MSGLEYMQQQAQDDYARNQQTQIATEQSIRDAQARAEYNAELTRQRQLEEDRRRQQGGY